MSGRAKAVKHTLVSYELPVTMTIADVQNLLDRARLSSGAPSDAIVTVKRMIGSHLDKEVTLVDINWTEALK